MTYHVVDENEETLFICHSRSFADHMIETIQKQIDAGLYKMNVKIKEVDE